MMKYIVSLFFTLLVITTSPAMVSAQSRAMQKAKIEYEREQKMKKQEQSRFNEAKDSKNLSVLEAFVKDYPNSSNTPRIRKRVDEIKLWNTAKTSNTLSSYRQYLDRSSLHWYDSEATSGITSIRQQQEKSIWEKVKAQGTLQAYEQYLRDNPDGGYREEAEKLIQTIKGAEEWQRIQTTSDIEQIRKFIAQYPNAPAAKIAEERLHELQGRAYFDHGYYAKAYTEFSGLKRSQLRPENRQAYDNVHEAHDFNLLGTYPSDAALNQYLAKYPNGQYADRVSNMLAVVKAQNLSTYASMYDYNDALSYAKDDQTRKKVASYISANKKLQKDRANAFKNAERRENGGWVQVGVTYVDMNFSLKDDAHFMFTYNTGVHLKIGNYKDRVQFSVGLMPGIAMYNRTMTETSYYGNYYEREEGTKTEFTMPIMAQLKLNLFKLSENSRFVLLGQYQYNLVRVKEVMSDMTWGVGFGFSWKHLDLTMQYRQDIGYPDWETSPRQKYLGMTLTGYW